MKSILCLTLVSSTSSIYITRLQLIPSIHAVYFASTKILSREFLDNFNIQSFNFLSHPNNLKLDIHNHAFTNEILSVMLYIFFIGINNYYYNKDKIYKFQKIGYFKECVNITKVCFLIIFFTLIRNVDRAI